MLRLSIRQSNGRFNAVTHLDRGALALGQFQSDQYPNMRPDGIVLSFRDPAAIEALHAFADQTDDDDLAVTIVKCLDAIAEELRMRFE